MTDKKMVKNEDVRPCGCHVTTFADDTSVVVPCLPCGLLGTAQALARAADAIGAAAEGLRRRMNAAEMQRAVGAVSKQQGGQ